MNARNTREAWAIANEIFPTDYEKNETASASAGYDIYRSTVSTCGAWISDLGNRLEVNLADGTTVNIWITNDNEPAPATVETVITLEANIQRVTERETVTTLALAELTLTYATALRDIATFERDAKNLVKRAKKASKAGEFVTVTLTRSTYLRTSASGLHLSAFEEWTGRGNSITPDGVHLTPSETYNNNPDHDIYISLEKSIFEEITI